MKEKEQWLGSHALIENYLNLLNKIFEAVKSPEEYHIMYHFSGAVDVMEKDKFPSHDAEYESVDAMGVFATLQIAINDLKQEIMAEICDFTQIKLFGILDDLRAAHNIMVAMDESDTAKRIDKISRDIAFITNLYNKLVKKGFDTSVKALMGLSRYYKSIGKHYESRMVLLLIDIKEDRVRFR